jgi:ribosomal protein S17E
MLAMRRLQRAVNNKDKDIQGLKSDFEKNKKLLEQMVKEIKEKEAVASQAASNHNTSMTSGGPYGQ